MSRCLDPGDADLHSTVHTLKTPDSEVCTAIFEILNAMHEPIDGEGLEISSPDCRVTNPRRLGYGVFAAEVEFGMHTTVTVRVEVRYSNGKWKYRRDWIVAKC